MNAPAETAHGVQLQALWRLARFCGVSPSYQNVRGERVHAKPEAVLHALRAFGVDIESPEQACEAMREMNAERARRILEPVTVLWRSGSGDASRTGGAAVTLRLARDAGGSIECRLMLESGEKHEWTTELAGHPVVETGEGEEMRRLSLPHELPLGYHRLEIDCDGRVHQSWMFIAPRRACELHRGWGVFMPLYAMGGKRNWGAGDFTDLATLTNWIGGSGGACVGTLPLLAASRAGDGLNPSPYTPTSRLFWNEMYIDVEAVPEFQRSTKAQSLMGSSEFQEAINACRESAHVQHDQVLSLKRRALEAMAESVFAQGGARYEAIEQAAQNDPELTAFASFCANHEQVAPPPIRERAERFHLYAQVICREQLRKAADSGGGCGLYLDLPVGVAPDGFDAMRFSDSFVHEASAGAPPDEFFTHGQNWGILPLHPHRTRENGHMYFREVIKRHAEFASVLRIDHVMWMHRTYWAPHGMPASEGVYVRYPSDELYAILCIESHRHSVPIVGENLGTVPAAVNRTMRRHNIKPLYVAQFSWTGNARHPLAAPDPEAVASLNTHDTPTFAEYWSGGDVVRRMELELLNGDEASAEEIGREDIRRTVIGFVRRHRVRLRSAGRTSADMIAIARALLVELARSDAALVLVTLEDLWAEERPQNVPGTSGGLNWRRKASRTLGEMRCDRGIAAFFEKLREIVS